MPAHRTFISFELPPDIRSSVLEFRSRLEPFFSGVRWEPPQKFHATIRFLGGTDEAAVPPVLELMRNCTRRLGAIPLTVTGFGAFPSLRRPRVLWIGCENSDGRLLRLHGEIDAGLEALGFRRDDRAFHPHVTIGRVRERGGSPYLTSIPKNLTFSPRHTVVGEIFLMKSVLKPDGSEYSVLGSAILG